MQNQNNVSEILHPSPTNYNVGEGFFKLGHNKANLPIRLENLKNGVCLSGWEAHYSPDGNKVAEAELPGTNPLTAAEYDGKAVHALDYDQNAKVVLGYSTAPTAPVVYYQYDKSFTLCKADILLYGSALSATEYDELRLTAAAYDAMRIEASEYDMYGVQYGGLGGTAFGLTAKQYDDTGLKAMEYDALNLTAQEYDLFPPSVYEGLTTKVEIDLFYGYDELERLVAVHREGSAGQLLAKYEYDANGNRSRMRVPYNGLETRYTYNKANLPVRLENLKNGVCLSGWEAHYSPDGNKVAEAELPGTNPLTAAEYDGYCLTAQGYDGKAVHALDYDQNAKVVLGYSTAQAAPVVYYRYDRLGRLAEEARAGWNTIQYAYDRFHNRTKMVVSGEETYETAYEYDANNRLLKTVKTGSWAGVNSKTETGTYSYDANGSQLRRETQKAAGGQETELREYNGFGQLTAVRTEKMTAEYSYRPDGLRHGKRVNGIATTHHWNGQDLVMESGATGFVKARYLRGINLLAQQIDGRLYTYLFNLHGDVVQRVAENGDAAPRYEYDAFGNQRKAAGAEASGGLDADPNPFRYCGEYFDSETGEVYLRARVYNTVNGRFTSEDLVRHVEAKLPNGTSIIDPLSLNLYTYCENDPIRYQDKNGTFVISTFLVAIAVGALLGAASGGISAAMSGENVVAGAIGGAVTGAFLGGLTAWGAGLGAMILAGGATSAANSAFQQGINTGKVDLGEVAIDGVFGAASGGIGRGLNKASKLLFLGDTSPKLGDALLTGMEWLAEEPLKYALSGISKYFYYMRKPPKATSVQPAQPYQMLTSQYRSMPITLPNRPSASPSVGGSYTVVSGDSFWAIAARLLGSGSLMYKLAAANGMTINSTIHPGMRLVIPK